MSLRKTSAIADLAARADAGRQLVVSVGSLDGPMLRALAGLNLLKNVENSGEQGSTWGEGIATYNADSQMPDELTKLPYSKPKAEGK